MAAVGVTETPQGFPDSPIDSDEVAYPCKGCGEILEEGKAFELAGNRWHIDCFRCNTCNTLLDSDANLLLLGDGSLICNNCTYSCSSCSNKIEDLAILTGDQAFCSNCFKCRNCKRKIENLRYARTSQGIFCMDCHEALMARRRKKTARNAAQRSKTANMDKSLPAIPRPEARHTAYIPPTPDIYPDTAQEVIPEIPSLSRVVNDLRPEPDPETGRPMTSAPSSNPAGLVLPPTSYRSHNRQSFMSHQSELSGGGEEFLIPLTFDPSFSKAQSTTSTQSPQMNSQPTTEPRVEEPSRDYFASNRSASQTPQPAPGSNVASPHLAQQEKGRKEARDKTDQGRVNLDGADTASTSKPTPAAVSPMISTPPSRQGLEEATVPMPKPRHPSHNDPFKLQEAPKPRRASSNLSTPRADTTPNLGFARSGPGPIELEAPVTTSSKPAPVELEAEVERGRTTPRASYEQSPTLHDGYESPRTPLNPAASILHSLPKRGDSLESSKRQQMIPRKEVNSAANVPVALHESNTPSTLTSRTGDSARVNGSKTISAPFSSPASQSILEAPNLPQTSGDSARSTTESFVEPRNPPAPPFDPSHSRTESGSTIQSDPRMAEPQRSPKLPRYSAGGEFTLDEDMARILGMDEPSAHESFLRRVSNSVRHGRSYSDRSGRLSRDRWPRSPIVASSSAGQEISSPATSSPENREELAWFKNELRRERQRNLDREKKITELEAQLNSAASITQVNTELKEKRSTMVVLDTQKEIVVRELEVLTEHIATAKKTGEPFDVGQMTTAVLRDLAESLEGLKSSFTPQIETLVHERNTLLDDIANLTQSKDKSFQEFEQLSSKNAQLADFNNQLVDQIQNIYKSNRGLGLEDVKPNGLGIYSNHKDKQTSVDSREVRAVTPNQSMSEATMLEAGEAGAAQVAQGAHVVDLKKGQVTKKFDWRRGQKMAKGLTKGVKGAFASTQQNYSREMSFAETGAYNVNNGTNHGINNGVNSSNSVNTPTGLEVGSLPKQQQELPKPGWFSSSKNPPRNNGLYPSQNNASTPSLLADAATVLFGADLTERAEYEKADIPGIVKRCIQEVEDRGMDVEGIYRKSGGNSQVNQVKEGFERYANGYDISDPDLDIHAVTSGLKQYFRKLPVPLITFEAYEMLIEITSIPEGPNHRSQRIEALQNAVESLPRVHYDTLEYLMKHLARVVRREKENLMTSMNVAVVFAPTIMRPQSIQRELIDTKAKNEVVMWMVEDVDKIFAD